MDDYINILDLDDFAFKELRKDPHIDKLHLFSSDKRKISHEIYAKNSKLTYVEKKIVKLYIGLENFKKYSVMSIAKKLNLKVYQVRYYLNSAFYKIKRNKYKYDNMFNLHDLDLNYDVLNSTPLSSLQYNVLILLFKYKVNPHDIEIYFFVPNLSTIIFTLYKKYPNLIINKKGEYKMDMNKAIKFKSTRSNRYILRDINIKELLNFFDNKNMNILQVDILLTILEGQTRKADMEKHPEFKNICKYIDEFRENTTHTSSSTLKSSESTDISNKEDKIQIEVQNNSSNLESVITDKFFTILKANIKIKKKKRNKLFKLWKQKNNKSLNIILNELDKIISKNKSKKSK